MPYTRKIREDVADFVYSLNRVGVSLLDCFLWNVFFGMGSLERGSRVVPCTGAVQGDGFFSTLRPKHAFSANLAVNISRTRRLPPDFTARMNFQAMKKGLSFSWN